MVGQSPSPQRVCRAGTRQALAAVSFRSLAALAVADTKDNPSFVPVPRNRQSQGLKLCMLRALWHCLWNTHYVLCALPPIVTSQLDRRVDRQTLHIMQT
mmetsp:Transcript_66247/g.117640  ORF Transcript_66247/g.117640 Transcript_66247/m.117640 type:complete len:99 (+) Transcript_66247:190-486(+)